MTPAGLPHSEIPGSQPACGSPRLFAACYVLHRRSAPRHPPFTLSSLTIHKPETLACSALENPIELSKIISRSRRTSPNPALQRDTARTDADWWSRSGSNRRPPPCKGGALPTELLPPTEWPTYLIGGPKWI